MDTQIYAGRMQQAVGRCEDELKKVRTGRANPGMLEGIMVEVYGSRVPLLQTASITVPEPQQLAVTPFDPSNLQAIAKAIREDQTLGLNPSDDGRVVRISIPPLTTERRQEIAKQIGDKVEEARIALRGVRHDALKDAKVKKEAKELSEDDVKRLEKAMDDLIQSNQAKLDSMARAKEQEIMQM